MIRAIYVFAACCFVACAAGCFTAKDADGKGSRKLIAPALTITTTRADEKGQARTMTILPFTYGQKSLTSPDGKRTDSWAVGLAATAWKKTLDPTGNEDRELFIAPLLTYYHKKTSAAKATGAVPTAGDFTEDYQTIVLLMGYHKTMQNGVLYSWGYFNILFDYVRTDHSLTVKLFHIIPIPFSSAKKTTTP